MFTRISYDPLHNKVYCVEIDEGKRNKIEFHPKFEFYIQDKSGQSPYKDIYGNSVKLVECEKRAEMKQMSEVMTTYENDLSGDIKFLQKRYLGKKLKVDMDNFQVATLDIEVESPAEFPKPEEAKYPINLISVHYSKENQVYTFGNRPYTGESDAVKNYHYCADEKTMLERFIKHWRKKNPDIASGWAIRTFDIPYIIQRCENLGIEISLSPINKYNKKKWRGYHIKESEGYEIAGVSILDEMDLYKNYEREKQTSYSLQNIGTLVVGEGKKDYDGTINNAWEHDWNGFVEYNVHDAILVTKIEEKKKYIPLTITLCYDALIPFEKIFSTISLVEGFILKFLHENNLVMPELKFERQSRQLPGAHVFANPGYYKHCISYDVESLYPSQILIWNISPETLKKDDNNFGKTPLSEYKPWETAQGSQEFGGVYYDRSKIGIMPSIIKKILTERKSFKKKMFIADAIEHKRDLSSYDKDLVQEVKEEGESSEYYDLQQYVRKIYANSVFGSIAAPFFHLYNFENALTITLGGQDIIKYLYTNFDEYMKNNFHKVVKKIFPNFKGEFKQLKNNCCIQTDTDSAYVCLDEVIENLGISFKTNEEFFNWANDLDIRFITPFFDKVLKIYANNYGIEQLINFKREKIITQKIITAKKKYVDEILANEDKLYLKQPKISVTGIEIVRTDTPQFCRDKLNEAVGWFFEVKCSNKSKIVERIKQVKEEFKESEFKEIAIPKGVSEYTKWANPTEFYIENGLEYPPACPIHVRASMNYNYLIAKYKLPLMQVMNGTKVKFIHITPNNLLHQDVIAFINDWPESFNDWFKIDIERQFNRTYVSVIQRFFDVLNWGEIQIESNALSDFIQF